jgi:multimeric flavodoxin WrbA
MADNISTKNHVIIFGSSRSHGNTKKAIDEIIGSSSLPLIDLNDFDITPFDYKHRNKDDDFIPLIEKIVDYNTLIIATPVYWYQMSTQHKIFFDRFSDLLKIRKDLGRRLRGKSLFVIASFQSSYPRGFEDTFEQICDYLGMKYLGSSFVYSGAEDDRFLKNNPAQISRAKAILEICN